MPELTGVSERAEVTGLPFYPQQTDQCGPASLATVLSHAGVTVTPEQLKHLVYIPGKGGSLAVELTAQARQHGLLAYPLRPQMNALLQEVAAGHPVLVMQNLGFNWWPKWHFAVVIGFDLSAEHILLRSGDQPRYQVDMALFEKTWARARRWALVVVPPDVIPASAEALTYLKAAADLEESGQYSAAAAAYKRASEMWPEQPLALFGLGNALVALERLQPAMDTYQKLLQAHPQSPETWNNMAFVYHRLSCSEAALASIDCALKLSPADPVFLDSLAELRALPKPDDNCRQRMPPACPL